MGERAFTILVTGSREAEAEDATKMTDILMEVAQGKGYPCTLIHGNARGADRIADHIGRMLGWHVVRHEAQWERYGRAAGHMRNGEMIRIGKPDIVVAFFKPGHENRGTSDCVKQAEDAGVSVVKVEL